mmetsp:Transcript_37921/g.93934  ORF Transcript_37921/g.93934 Transcript_37921/m.93934 type:complete len:97 (+) Transcript_37921:62-352(+)
MLDDVTELVAAVDNNAAEAGNTAAAPFAAAAISALGAASERLAQRVSQEVVAAAAMRPGVAEVWAENTRDETMRAELESLFERAAEDADAAATDAQ